MVIAFSAVRMRMIRACGCHESDPWEPLHIGVDGLVARRACPRVLSLTILCIKHANLLSRLTQTLPQLRLADGNLAL